MTIAPHQSDARPRAYDVEAVRRDFPILARRIHGKPLVYLDTAATAQRPRAVIDAVDRFWTTCNANVHRGVHTLSIEATDAFEQARARLQRFINAAEVREIIFTRGATEAINLVAQCWARPRLKPGDIILIGQSEHHSNIVPWQMVREWTGAEIRVIPVTDAGELDVAAYQHLLEERVKLIAIQHVSNTLGTVHPLKALIAAARRNAPHAVVVVDGAQGAPHLRVDVRDLDADFYAVAGHKMYGPTGIGLLYGRRALLEAMPPWHGGGSMIRSVTFERTTYADLPDKYEAGTPNIAGAIGLAAAADYLDSLTLDAIAVHEHDLVTHAASALADVPGLRFIGAVRPPHRAGVVSFTLEGVHPHDIGTILDNEGIAIRTGHHCTQPLMQRFGVPATARASFGVYTTRQEIDALAAGLRKVIEVFA
ncbi:MAG: cysteine desulfurase [Phycisphaeraceae bacterium]|nr:cysteine desulfurase [Phycisphaerales bacterium]QOJ18889.1 MAG: cysteine desulfurase [Phycisphaeraceae bacterium]